MLDFGEFTQLARTYPLLLYPAFRLQDSMQRCTLGTRDWQLIFEANVRQQQKDEFARLFPGRKVPKQWFEKCPWRQLFYSMGRLHTGRVDPDYISKARPNAVRRAEEKRLEAEANARMGVSGGDANKVYKVGDLVEAKKDGQGDWLAGTVDDVTDGKKGKTYLVVFADGGQDPEAKAANMKPR